MFGRNTIPPFGVTLLSQPGATSRSLEPWAAVLLFGAGVVIGTAFIVLGQLILVFLDIRARLERIDRRLRDWDTSTARESPLTERLRPR